MVDCVMQRPNRMLLAAAVFPRRFPIRLICLESISNLIYLWFQIRILCQFRSQQRKFVGMLELSDAAHSRSMFLIKPFDSVFAEIMLEFQTRHLNQFRQNGISAENSLRNENVMKIKWFAGEIAKKVWQVHGDRSVWILNSRSKMERTNFRWSDDIIGLENCVLRIAN